MSGKKMVFIIVAIAIIASAAAVISILLFFNTYEPKPPQEITPVLD